MKQNLSNSQSTEALLEGLIGECQALIRDVIRPAIRECDHDDRREYFISVTGLMDSAVKLGDAVGRLRGDAPPPEVRQRITVEKVQRLAPPKGEA
jgi:hypothetical protein